LAYFLSGDSANIGKIVNGDYYYLVNHKGIYRYTPSKGAACLIRAPEFTWYEVNEYGVFYTKGRSLYVRIHETGKKQKIYTADRKKYSRIVLKNCLDNGNLVVTLYSKNSENKYDLKVGKTGNILKQESASGNTCGEMEYQAGPRTFHCMTGAENSHLDQDLQENGISVRPKGAVFSNARSLGDNLLIQYKFHDDDQVYQMLARSSGGFNDVTPYQVLCGTNDYLLYIKDYSGEPCPLYCYEIETGESYLLHTNMEIFQAVTDGTWLFTCVPWNGGKTDYWKMIYDNAGKPIELNLIDHDI